MSPDQPLLPSVPEPTPPSGRVGLLRLPIKRVIVALVIAGLSDVICAFFTLAPPIVWTVDILTAGLLFIVLGWHWLLLPGLVMEAIPGLGVIPFWLLVVAAIAVLGTARPKWPLPGEHVVEAKPR